MIPEKLSLDVFDRSWKGPWDRFGIILDHFWGPLGSLGAFRRGPGVHVGGVEVLRGGDSREWCLISPKFVNLRSP